MTKALRKPEAAPDAVLTQATIRAAELLGLTSTNLAKVIGVSDATVSRYKKEDARLAVSSKQAQLALLLIRVFRSLDPLVGSDSQKRKAWMSTQNKALNGIPSELILSPDGLTRTLAYLDGMRAAT